MSKLLSNSTLIYPLFAWGLAQGIKILIHYVRTKRFEPRLMMSSGGMPSSHAALVCAIAVAIALREGLDSSLFALACVLAGVVMYDAAGVRRAAGHQATVLNQIIEEIFQGESIRDEKLQELLGHTPTQVIMGAILGVLCSWIGMSWIWNG
jgi:acid phosphatase family membrane protein YuiD